MSPRDLVDEGIAAGALEWMPDDHDTAPPAGSYAPPADRVVTTAPAFDGCHFCLAPSPATRAAQLQARDRLAAAIEYLDAARRVPHDDDPIDVLTDAITWLEAAARELVGVIR